MGTSFLVAVQKQPKKPALAEALKNVSVHSKLHIILYNSLTYPQSFAIPLNYQSQGNYPYFFAIPFKFPIISAILPITLCKFPKLPILLWNPCNYQLPKGNYPLTCTIRLIAQNPRQITQSPCNCPKLPIITWQLCIIFCSCP